MARRRRLGFAWIFVLLLAAVYWIQRNSGISTGGSFTDDINKLSEEGFKFFPWALGIVFVVVLLRFLFGGRETSEQGGKREP